MAKYAYHRLDANHRTIRDGLRQVGATVNEKGPLDLLVGFRGRNFLLEVKTARGRIRTTQKAFLSVWQGQACVVRTLNEALIAIGWSLQ